MGQEIAYCALCGCQLRSVDFEKGGAFRVDLQSYCKKCAPEAVKSLPPEKIQAILKQGIAPPSRPSKPVAEGEGPSPSSRAIRISPRKSGPQQSLIVATASVGLGAVVLLLFLVFSGRPSPEPEASRSLPARPPVEPAPVAIKPPEPRPIAGGSSPAEQVGKKPAEPVVAPLPREAPEPAPAAPNPPESAKPAEHPKAPLPEPRPPEPAHRRHAPVEPATSPAAASKRPGVPAADKLREAEAAYQKTFRPDLVKAPADKAKLARTLLSSAASSGAKDAELYVLLREARDLAAAGMDPATALEAIEAKAGAFDVNPVADTLDLFTKSTAKGAAAATWGGTLH